MSDERVDIEVSDKVDGAIATKLRDIAKEARGGQSSVDKLKQSLNDINSTPVRKLAEASSQLSGVLGRELKAQAGLSAALKNSTDAEARLTRAKKDAADAQNLLRGANVKAADVLRLRKKLTDEVAAAELNAQNSAKALAAATRDADRAEKSITQQRNALLRSTDPVGFAQAKLNQQMMLAGVLYRNGAITQQQYTTAMTALNQRVQQATVLQNGLTTAQQRGIMAARGLTGQMIGFGQALYLSKDPMQALLMYGSQFVSLFGSSRMTGGFSGMASGVLAFVRSAGPAIVIVGALAAGFGLLHRELSKGYPKDITEGLKLTEEQLKRVENRTVTFGDTIIATFQVAGEDIMNGPIGPAIEWVGDTFNKVMDWIASDGEKYMAIVKGTMIGTLKFVMDNWRKFPAAFGDLFAAAANIAIEKMEGLVNSAVDRINSFISGVNQIPGIELPTLSRASMARVQREARGAGMDLAKDYVSTVVDEMGNQYRASEERAGRIGAAALRRAQQRALRQAGDPNKAGGGRGGGRGGQGEKEWDRAGELQNVNRELDNELARMGMLKDAREVQNRLDQISQKFAEKRAPLNDAETASIKRKLEAIQGEARVQTELDRIHEEAVGPMNKYNASVEAANRLRQQGVITQQQYSAELYRAGEAYAAATNPLHELNRSIEQQIALTGLYGMQLEIATQMQAAQNAMLAQGKTLIDASTGALNAEGLALQNKITLLNMLQQAQAAQAQTGFGAALQSFLQYRDGMASAYATINQMVADNKTTFEQAERQKAAIQSHYQNLGLSAAASYFGDLAGLASSGNKTLAGIGKAAAIAQATINGYLAVSKAYTTLPYPFNIAAAAAQAALSAAQVAGIMSTNVGNFQHGGSFVVKGRDGVDKNNINMNVSKGERVTIETLAQQRKGGGANVQIFNYAKNTTVEQERTPDGDIRVIVRDEMRQQLPKLNEEQFNDPNSKTSKAAGRAFGLTRNRGS